MCVAFLEEMANRSRSSSAKRKREGPQSSVGSYKKTKQSNKDEASSKKVVKTDNKDEDEKMETEEDEEAMNMADVSGFSRYSIETLDEDESEKEVEEEDDNSGNGNTSGATDAELTNDCDSGGKTRKKGGEDRSKVIKMPIRGASRGKTRAVLGTQDVPGRGRKAKGKVPLHPMIYEQQSYNSAVPMWEDSEEAPVVHRGYLTYKEDDAEQEGGEGDWRDVGYFNTADRRRLHGDYDQYIEDEDEPTYDSPSARSRRTRRRVSFGAEVKYSLTAHAISLLFVFVILVITFLFMQYIDLWGHFKDSIWSTYYSMYDLYSSLASGSYTFTCSVGGSPFQMIECEIKQSFNRLLLSAVTQCVQFVNVAMKVDNVPHAIALLAGAYSALSAAVWSIKWPLKQLGRGLMGLLTGAYDGALRVCHNSGI